MQLRKFTFNRIFFLLFVSTLFSLVILGKLFHLQVMQHDYFAAKAEEGHLGYSEVSARRGEILIRDYHSKEVFRLATNTTFPLLFADPTLIKDASYIADKLMPLLFDKDAAHEKERMRIRYAKRLLPDNPSQKELSTLTVKNEEELRSDFRAELFGKISQKTRQKIVIFKSPNEETTKAIRKFSLPGIEVAAEAIVAYPSQIGDQEYAAKVLSPMVDIPYERLKDILVGRNRYVVLRQKIPAEVEKQIRTLIDEDKKSKRNLLVGINFQEKSYRYYPEGQLSAQLIGFLSDGKGVYGIEQSFDNALRGKKGIFKTRLDATGQQVIVGDDLIIQPAIDGDSVILTIDRSIQMEVEKRLAHMVESVRADSGTVIVMEPKTGRVVSLAHYPSFDPNEFGKALETEDISLTEEEKSNIVSVGDGSNQVHYLYLDRDSHYRIQVFKDLLENGKTAVSKFKNILGPGVYRNHAVADLFEPGSVLKAVVMSIALDDGDVTPQTTFNDRGPIKVDEYEIHNALNTYNGITSMREVIERSLNTGMAFVARKIGRELMYRYFRKFGFGEKTDIEFDGEESGHIKEPNTWAESELVTYSFGQGIALTPIQLITAVSALANKGLLMKPQIVYKVEKVGGKVIEYQPEHIRRVISEKTADTIGAMMVSAVENGVARRAWVRGYHIAGKTGTAQTYKHGKPLTGPGTTIASFIGFAPFTDPKFAVLVKIDRPRSSIWADSTAAPLFAEIAEFLFKYYNIPPE